MHGFACFGVAVFHFKKSDEQNGINWSIIIQATPKNTEESLQQGEEDPESSQENFSPLRSIQEGRESSDVRLLLLSCLS